MECAGLFISAAMTFLIFFSSRNFFSTPHPLTFTFSPQRW
jgi:hypothetical protein